MAFLRDESKERPKEVYRTELGAMYCGKSENLLRSSVFEAQKGNVQLVFTSPPFPLHEKKKYGNLRGQEYIDWLAQFGPLLTDYLTPDGSVVLELGNAWEKRRPVMSIMPVHALLAFMESAGLNLCQEFVCFNPARLPSPAQWVTIERSRVKDAFTKVWWMAPTDRPKADNRRVLTAYSESMKKLLQRGTYNPGRRPSGHVIGDKSFLDDHGGAIPPNVLIPALEDMLPELLEVLPISNTRSVEPYQDYCRKHGLTPHPARMPTRLVEFFVHFLTDPGDLVLDPFAGSNTTGLVAESLGRKWIGIEANGEYVQGSRARFRPLTDSESNGTADPEPTPS